MENEIHHSESDNARINITSKECAVPKEVPLVSFKFVTISAFYPLPVAVNFFNDVFRIRIGNFDVLVSGDQKSARSKRWIKHGLADFAGQPF